MEKLHKERKAKSAFFQLFSHAHCGICMVSAGYSMISVCSCLVTKYDMEKGFFLILTVGCIMLGTVCAHLQPQPELRHYLRV